MFVDYDQILNAFSIIEDDEDGSASNSTTSDDESEDSTASDDESEDAGTTVLTEDEDEDEDAVIACGDNNNETDTRNVIRPLPWLNAPKGNGSKIQFSRRLARCQKKMAHLASHTPEHFLTHQEEKPQKKATRHSQKKTNMPARLQKKMRAAARSQKKGAGGSQGGEGKVVAVRQTAGQKRKALDEEEEVETSEGELWMHITTCPDDTDLT